MNIIQIDNKDLFDLCQNEPISKMNNGKRYQYDKNSDFYFLDQIIRPSYKHLFELQNHLQQYKGRVLRIPEYVFAIDNEIVGYILSTFNPITLTMDTKIRDYLDYVNKLRKDIISLYNLCTTIEELDLQTLPFDSALNLKHDIDSKDKLKTMLQHLNIQILSILGIPKQLTTELANAEYESENYVLSKIYNFECAQNFKGTYKGYKKILTFEDFQRYVR